MSKRLFDHDPLSRVTEWFHYDEMNDTFTIEKVQDVEAIVEANKRSYNSFTSGKDHWGEELNRGTHVARVPEVIYEDWLRTGAWRDEAYIKRWLNDPANRCFRTRPGVV